MTDWHNDHGGSEVLAACTSPASFWTPNLLRPESAWIEHAPFAFWLVDALRPKVIVELGCYSGFSYFVFCQAVQRLSLNTRCYAIDHWKGDVHSGFYGEDIFAAVSSHNELHYNSFSRLVRSEFHQAVTHFNEHSINLLHIDGVHSYDAVKSDFDHWRLHVSNDGIALFHDINVRERGFGVWQLWNELTKDHRHFAFLHGNGLGVLGLGERFADPLEKLFDCAADTEATAQIRLVYSRLGLALSDRIAHEALAGRLRKVEAEASELGRQARRQSYLCAIGSERAAEIERLRGQVQEINQVVSQRDAELHRLCNEHDADVHRLRNEHNAEISRLRGSLSWRATAPLREVMRFLRRIWRMCYRHNAG